MEKNTEEKTEITQENRENRKPYALNHEQNKEKTIDEEKEVIEVFQFENREKWIDSLLSSPSPTWIEHRDLGGGKKSSYISIGILQSLADKHFRECDVIDEKYKVVVNEIVCTVKLSILPDYPYSEHRVITGTGCKPIQVNDNKPASLFPEGKKTNSLEYNVPAARAEAIGNALATFANVFGRNLNRSNLENDFKFKRKTY